MSPPALRRYRAERLLRKEFSRLRSKVLTIVRSQLRSKGVTLNLADLEACYAQAWQGLYATLLNGEEVDNPAAWLVLVTFRRAIDESRSITRHSPGEATERAAAFDPDLAAELDHNARLRQVFEGLRISLSERECEAASLCYLQGLSRAQAAERMGLSESRMRKLMEGQGAGGLGVAAKVGELLNTIKAGNWCEQQSSLMRAFAFGVLNPSGERHALAMAHCRDCPACRAYVASLRGLAAVLPLPLLTPLALAGGIEGARAPAPGGGTSGASSAAKAGLRAGKAPSTGWGGLGGSLTTKLAVTVLVGLSAGYTVLGSRAHGSPHTAAGPVHTSRPLTSEAPSQAPLQAFSAPAPRSHTIRRFSTIRSSTNRSPTVHPRSSPKRTERSTSEASNREFLPERSKNGVPVVSSSVAPAQSHSSPPVVNEFGIE
jgi:RNA polymerase sigma factor (sigma-70 family)